MLAALQAQHVFAFWHSIPFFISYFSYKYNYERTVCQACLRAFWQKRNDPKKTFRIACRYVRVRR